MFPYIDMDCDTLEKAWHQKTKDIHHIKETMLNIKSLQQAACQTQFFAIFMQPITKIRPVSDKDYIKELRNIFENTIKPHPKDLVWIKQKSDLALCEKENKLGAVLTLEDGRYVNSQLDKLNELYQYGIRLITLTWNHENCFGFPASNDSVIMNRGLTEFGKGAISQMNELGILIDVSHLSDGGFYDVAKISKKPFAASHSNCRTLCNHPRNLTDDMIRMMGNKGGVIGVNFYPYFLDDDRNPKSTKELIAKHLRHMITVGGIECAAIGTDFDGIEGNIEINEPTKMQNLFEFLLDHGFTNNEVEHIAYKNIQRVLKDVFR